MTHRAQEDRLAEIARLRAVRDRIDREFDRPLDVEELARGAHMSAGHLARRFREAFGEPPYRYLMTRRVERAMMLPRVSAWSRRRGGDESETKIRRQMVSRDASQRADANALSSETDTDDLPVRHHRTLSAPSHDPQSRHLALCRHWHWHYVTFARRLGTQ